MSKIMFIHHSGALGGAGISLANNVSLLSKEHEVSVYIPSEPKSIKEVLESKKTQASIIEYGRRIGALTCYSGGDSIFSLRFFYRVLLIFKQVQYWNNEINKQSPDLIILNSMILCWMSRLNALKQRKTILFVRETMQGSPNRRINRLIRKFLDGIDCVVFLSKYDEDCMALRNAKTKIIYNSINNVQLRAGVSKEEGLDRLGIDKDKFTVLYVGGVSDMKGFDLAVRAVLSAGSDFQLIVAGNNFENALDTASYSAKAYAAKWKEYIQINDHDNQIIMLGRQSDMTNLFAACDVLLFPMRSPHQARPVFEAGYYHKPVIITDFDNITEFVTDGINGLTVQPYSVDSIVEKLLLLKNHPKQLLQLGERNAERTEEKHNPYRNYQKLCSTIEEIIKDEYS